MLKASKHFLPLVLLLASSAVGSAQWVSADRQAHEESLWKWTGVEFPAGMRFYDCKPAFQHVARDGALRPTYLLSSADYALVANDHNVNLLRLWRRPGGLQGTDRKHWRNATAVHLPGPLKVWKGMIEMRGAGSLPIWRWEYPDGTIFADMLIRKHDGQEWPFELRLREKRDGKWDDGIAYRPYASAEDLPKGAIKRTWELPTQPGEKLSLLGVDRLKATAWLLPETTDKTIWPAFKPSRIVATTQSDDAAIPPLYAGNVVACAKCHQHAGKSPGYASVIRGDDTILSFHPFEPTSISPNGINRRVSFREDVIDPKASLPTGAVEATGQGSSSRVSIIGGGR
jgi:hypothetical protein